MGADTGIAWTDHTHNPWIGCDEVGPACDDCYARFDDFRRQWGVPKEQAKANRAAGVAPHWGVNAPRHRTSETLRRQPYIWNEKARAAGKPAKVFSLSLGDVFDKRVPWEWRADLWRTIAETPYLRWILVTKRIPNADAMLPEKVPHNAGIVSTVVTQPEADRDVPRLLALKAKRRITWVGLSIEPQIELINLRALRCNIGESVDMVLDALTGRAAPAWHGRETPTDHARVMTGTVDWVITGGESKQGKDHVPRPYDLTWARALRDQCAGAGAAFFEKQLGARPITRTCTEAVPLSEPLDIDSGDLLPRWALKPLHDRQAGAEPSEWPADLRVRQYPEALLQ